jgi:hypothetical protein
VVADDGRHVDRQRAAARPEEQVGEAVAAQAHQDQRSSAVVGRLELPLHAEARGDRRERQP